VGAAQRLSVSVISTGEPVFPTSGEQVFPMRTVIQVRAHGGTAAASADLVDGRLRITLDEPLRGIAPGQTVVLYDPGNDRVRASATILRAA
jgi:tRNA-specific 2-thiouridylase